LESSISNVITAEKLLEQFNEFETATAEARAASELVRDHRDLKPYTAAELEEYNRRKQAPIRVPKIAAKVDFLTGLERQQRSDPKALPRTQKHEDDAQAATDALRFIADSTDFDDTASAVFEQAMLVEGYSAVVVEAVDGRNGIDVAITWVPFDRFYFDPHSRDRYFRDAAYIGVVAWIDVEVAKRRYPDSIDAIGACFGGNEADTFGDKPQWADGNRNRIKVLQHYFMHDGVWHVAEICTGGFLKKAAPSPYLDDMGQPECPIVGVSAYIDRENNRYSLGHSLVDLEDEVNHRRSKSLHLLSTKQLHYEKGSLTNPRGTSDELKKPDGAVEFPAGSLSEGRVQIYTGADLAAGQMQLLEEAKREIDARGASGVIQDMAGADLSGRAYRAMTNNAQLEIGPLLDSFKTWKRFVFRHAWNRVMQFWTEERWVRVTDNEKNVKWVGINQPITNAEYLKEEAESGNDHAAMMLEQMMAANDPRLDQVYEVRRRAAELDVDIIIDDSPDVLTVQQEQFEVLANLAQTYGPQNVPFEALLELSSVRNKDRVKELLSGGDNPMQQQMAAMQAEMQKLAAELELQKQAAQIDKIRADTAKTLEDARKQAVEVEQTQIENQIVAAFPDLRPTVTI
jgi:hypothetical protein